MPPSASNPHDMRLALNPARRRALTLLIEAIMKHMHNRVTQSFEHGPQADLVPLFIDPSPPGPLQMLGVWKKQIVSNAWKSD